MAKKVVPPPISVTEVSGVESALPSPDLDESKAARASARKSTKLTYTNFDDDTRYNAVR